MNRKITLIAISIMFCANISAQLEDGAFAPNFTATDINGNTWTLYDILDQGKSVVLDMSTTWCSPCWDYHQSGILEELYEEHGPEGTDEIVVLMIESDENTNIECLYGTNDCNSISLGDWTEGIDYPIIDSKEVADLYEVVYYPTLYIVCPNRAVTELIAPSASEWYDMHNMCEPASGENNMAIASYTGFAGNFCVSQNVIPSIILQNLGSSNLSEATIQLYINGTITETINWTGSLNTFQTTELSFAELTINENSEITIIINSVNGNIDDVNSNNEIIVHANLADEFSDNFVKLEIAETDYGGMFETYWEIVDENGNILYNGGNDLNVGGDGNTAYEENVSIELALPSDGCYEINFYELYGDGYQNVNYKLYDSSNQLIMAGPNVNAYKFKDVKHFNLSGGTDVLNNATLLVNNEPGRFFCFEDELNTSLLFQNLGANEITSINIDVSSDIDGFLFNHEWTGNIAPSTFGSIDLPQMILAEASKLTFEITGVNGQDDGHDYSQVLEAVFKKAVIKNPTITISVDGDMFSNEENTFAVINSTGDTLEFGIIPNSGLNETIILPLEDDCISLHILDSYGDGIGFDGTQLNITDANNNVVLDELLDFKYSIGFDIETQLFPSSISILESINNLNVFPNPTSENLNIYFQADENLLLNVNIYNALGEIVQNINDQNILVGTNNFSTNIASLANGAYYLRISNNEGLAQSKRFIIIH